MPSSPRGMVRRLGPPSHCLAKGSTWAFPTGPSAQGPLREGSPAHHLFRGISYISLPPREPP